MTTCTALLLPNTLFPLISTSAYKWFWRFLSLGVVLIQVVLIFGRSPGPKIGRPNISTTKNLPKNDQKWRKMTEKEVKNGPNISTSAYLRWCLYEGGLDLFPEVVLIRGGVSYKWGGAHKWGVYY